jgi:transcriptional regulator with XRE-family HTH domain
MSKRKARHASSADLVRRAKRARLSLGGMLGEARVKAKLTLQKAASRLGFATYKPMWLIERGMMPVPPDKIPGLAALYDLPLRTLFAAEVRCRLLQMGFDVDGILIGSGASREEPGAIPEQLRTDLLDQLAGMAASVAQAQDLLRRHGPGALAGAEQQVLQLLAPVVEGAPTQEGQAETPAATEAPPGVCLEGQT